jgi:hypothetical protein
MNKMVIQTRLGLPKWQLYKKFRTDFFGLLGIGGRISRNRKRLPRLSYYYLRYFSHFFRSTSINPNFFNCVLIWLQYYQLNEIQLYLFCPNQPQQWLISYFWNIFNIIFKHINYYYFLQWYLPVIFLLTAMWKQQRLDYFISHNNRPVTIRLGLVTVI